MQKIMQGQVMNNPEEVSLRPAANSMLFKKNANPPKPSMGLNSGENRMKMSFCTYHLWAHFIFEFLTDLCQIN